MLTKISEFVKTHLNDIILLLVVILLAMFAFAAGYITAKNQIKTPIQIIQN